MTAAENVQRLEALLAGLEAAGTAPDELDEMALAAAERYEAAGDYYAANLVIGLVSLSCAMRAHRIPQIRQQLAVERARAERIATIKTSGRRLALPELDAGLRGAS